MSWKSTNVDVAAIAEDGTVTAKGAGQATIKVTVGEVSATCKVNVVQPVTSIYLNKTALEMTALDTYPVSYTHLQKDGKEIEASVTNFADYQTKPENCAISTLAFYADDTKNPEVKLPGGITIKSTSDDLKKWAGDKFDYSKSGDSESYSYYEDNGSIDINCKKTINLSLIHI